MPYRWLDHTGELGLQVEAPDEEGVFRDAVAALGEIIDTGDGERESGKREQRRIAVDGRDREALLVECLTETLFHAETENLIPMGLSDVRLLPERLEATLEAKRGRAKPLVKAATYHHLRFERFPGGWRANVVLDV
jgi:SHS2 domain-containing protein